MEVEIWHLSPVFVHCRDEHMFILGLDMCISLKAGIREKEAALIVFQGCDPGASVGW